MSIRDRLDDAKFLFDHGRRDGAFLSVLVAVGATSRRRYPDRKAMDDRNAFIRFLLDENPLLVRSDWVPTSEDDYLRCIDPSITQEPDSKREGGWWIEVAGAAEWGWRDNIMPLATCLYKIVRNNLAHEAALPNNIEFIEAPPGALRIEITKECLRISNSVMDGPNRAVKFAPENFDLFPEIAEMPRDVVGWMLFKHDRHNREVYMQQRAERIERLSGNGETDDDACEETGES